MARTPFFFWYELMTTDVEAARKFYEAVIGWKGQAWDGADMSGRPYIVMNIPERGIAGIMNLPESAAQSGMPPAWVGYIYSSDVDASAKSLQQAGGTLHRGPENIPGVGRFAVVADPQGAMFMFLKPDGPDQPPLPPETPGNIGWHELYTSDLEAGFAFYADQFGWQKDETFDMGEMGPYQLFRIETGKEAVGAMMAKPPHVPVSAWQFTFNVPDIDAAVTAARDNGGKIAMEPMEVPGGQWAALCQDPQGAVFGVVAPAGSRKM